MEVLSGCGHSVHEDAPDKVSILWQYKHDKNIKKQTQLCSLAGDNCKLNYAKVQRSSMLQTQLCKSTKVVHAANSTVQSTKVVHAANSTVQKYKGCACCKLNCTKVQMLWDAQMLQPFYYILHALLFQSKVQR